MLVMIELCNGDVEGCRLVADYHNFVCSFSLLYVQRLNTFNSSPNLLLVCTPTAWTLHKAT